jgi:hypothetical protein
VAHCMNRMTARKRTLKKELLEKDCTEAYGELGLLLSLTRVTS